MPYRRNRRYARKRKRPYRYRRKRDTVKKVRRAVRAIQRSVETKNYIFQSGFFTVLSPANPTAYSDLQPGEPLIGQGTEVQDYIGIEYHARGIKLHMTLEAFPNQSLEDADSVRVTMLQLKGAAAVAGTISWQSFFDTTATAASGVASIPPYYASLRTSKSGNQVKILHDAIYPMGENFTNGATPAAGAVATGPLVRDIRMYKRLNFISKNDQQLDQRTGGRVILFVHSRLGGRVSCNFVTKFYFKDP